MRPLIALAACVLVAACGGGTEEDDGRTASGQVLEGTISDSMLPLDTVRSQPPLAKPSGTSGERGEGGDAPAAEATDAPEEEETAAPEEDAPAEDDEG